MFDEDVSEKEWAALRRATSALFEARYGERPRITHGRETPEEGRADEDRCHRITLRAPATPLRNPVEGSIGSREKADCYLWLIRELHEKLDSHRYDPCDDEWIVAATGGAP